MKLSVEYNHKELTPEQIEAGQTKEQNIETTCNLISAAVNKAHPEGFDGNGGLRRVWGRLQRKMEAAMDNNTNEIEMDEAEADLIKKALTNAKMPLQWSKYINLLEDALYEMAKQPIE